MSSLSLNNLPPINPANEPANIRNGDKAAKDAYQTGLAFEQLLVDQLSQELAQTASSGTDGSGADSSGSDGTSSGADTSGLMGTGSADSTYAQMLPQALTSSVMSAGGLGVAAQIAAGLDPALNQPAHRQATPTQPAK